MVSVASQAQGADVGGAAGGGGDPSQQQQQQQQQQTKSKTLLIYCLSAMSVICQLYIFLSLTVYRSSQGIVRDKRTGKGKNKLPICRSLIGKFLMLKHF